MTRVVPILRKTLLASVLVGAGVPLGGNLVGASPGVQIGVFVAGFFGVSLLVGRWLDEAHDDGTLHGGHSH